MRKIRIDLSPPDSGVCQDRQIREQLKNIHLKPTTLPRQTGGQRHLVIGEALNSGRSIQSIMSEFSIKQDTIFNHLAKYLQDGRTIKSPDQLLKLSKLSADQQHLVFNTFKRLGPEFLKPIFDALDGNISYQELKILRLCYLIQKH